jgi:hypothetical protein
MRWSCLLTVSGVVLTATVAGSTALAADQGVKGATTFL